MNPEATKNDPLTPAALQVTPMNPLASLVEARVSSSPRSGEPDYGHIAQKSTQALANLKSDPSALSKYAATGMSNSELYQQNTQGHIDGFISELRGIIRRLISAVRVMRSDSEGPDLGTIEKQIMELQTLDGLAIARENLEMALEQLTKAERTRKQEASGLLTRLHERVLILEEYASKGTSAPAQPLENTVRLQKAVVKNQGGIASAGQVVVPNAGIPSATGASLDRLTGLPNREAAETSIFALEGNPRNKYVAAFYIQNMQQLNARFGDRICDELLFLITQRIATNLLRPSDQIFRWRGPAFVAILEREESFSYVGHDLKRFVEHPLQFEFRSGSLLVFISIAAELVCPGSVSPAEQIQELEKFYSSF